MLCLCTCGDKKTKLQVILSTFLDGTSRQSSFLVCRELIDTDSFNASWGQINYE